MSRGFPYLFTLKWAHHTFYTPCFLYTLGYHNWYFYVIIPFPLFQIWTSASTRTCTQRFELVWFPYLFTLKWAHHTFYTLYFLYTLGYHNWYFYVIIPFPLFQIGTSASTRTCTQPFELVFSNVGSPWWRRETANCGAFISNRYTTK